MGGRIGASWIVAASAWGALEGGVAQHLLACVVLACAAAFAAGLSARLSGTLLAATAPLDALAPGTLIPQAAGVDPGAAAVSAAPWWLALAAVCLLGALLPGRLSADALVARRREAARRRRGAQCGSPGGAARNGRRPEEAPPLPYPGVGAALKRPSRI